MWNVATKWWLSQISTTLCQQIMIGNITQPFHTNDLSWMVGRKTTFPSFHVLGVKFVCASFCFLVEGNNPEESCKVQFEGNLEPISRVYKELQLFSLLTVHPTTLLQLLIMRIMRIVRIMRIMRVMRIPITLLQLLIGNYGNYENFSLLTLHPTTLLQLLIMRIMRIVRIMRIMRIMRIVRIMRVMRIPTTLLQVVIGNCENCS